MASFRLNVAADLFGTKVNVCLCFHMCPSLPELSAACDGYFDTRVRASRPPGCLDAPFKAKTFQLYSEGQRQWLPLQTPMQLHPGVQLWCFQPSSAWQASAPGGIPPAEQLAVTWTTPLGSRHLARARDDRAPPSLSDKLWSVFYQMDGTDKGYVLMQDLERALQRCDIVLTDRTAGTLFSLVDRNRSQHITIDEWGSFGRQCPGILDALFFRLRDMGPAPGLRAPGAGHTRARPSPYSQGAVGQHTPGPASGPVHRQVVTPQHTPRRQYSEPPAAAHPGGPAQWTPRNSVQSAYSPSSTGSVGRRTPALVRQKLYGHPISQPSRSVQWFIDYANLDVEVEHVDILSGKNKEPAFVAKFPNAKVPAFEKGGFKLEEGAAILEYLAERHPVVPRDKRQRARVMMMIGRTLAQARKVTSGIVVPMFFGKDDEKAGLIKEGIENVRPELQMFDAVLSKSLYLAGNELSLADFMFVPEVDQLSVMKQSIGVDLLADYPNIASYLQRIGRVSGYKKCVDGVINALAAAPKDKPKRAKLYGHPISQPSRSVQWFIDYANLDVEVEHVDILSGKNKEPAFVAKFPNAKVPAFEKGGFKLEEGAAILEYLAEGHPIVPRDKRQRARVTMMIGRTLAQARKVTSGIVVPMFFGKDDEKAGLIKEGIENVRPELQMFDAVLSKSLYLAGNELSLADFMFVPEVDQLSVMKQSIGVDLLADYPNIASYLQRISRVGGYNKCVGGVIDALAK